MHVKKGDTVVITAGKDKGKKGKVLMAMPKKDRVVVEGINMVTKHQKPNPRMQTGGIFQKEAPIHVSNVMIWDEKAKSGSRVRHTVDNGKKVRVAIKSGEVID
jgi:large subunit ribosomal protein L24